MKTNFQSLSLKFQDLQILDEYVYLTFTNNTKQNAGFRASTSHYASTAVIHFSQS